MITEQEFAKAIGTSRIPLPGLNAFLMSLMKINHVNESIKQVNHLQGIAFIEAILAVLDIQIKLDEKDLQAIPKNGAFLVVANHPYGGVEGLILLKLLSQVRPDIKLMANFLLKRIEGLSSYLIPVNPFDDAKVGANVGGLRHTLDLLKQGVPVAIFPAGEVSSFNPALQRVTDKQWHPVVGKLIAKANVPVIPVYFHGNNGLLFNILGIVHPKLRTARLPAELFNKKGHQVQVRFGKAVEIETLPSALRQPKPLLDYLRARTYALGTGVPSNRKRLLTDTLFRVRKKAVPVAAGPPLEELKSEVDQLTGYEMLTVANYAVYIAPASAIPKMIKEIGRLREETFRGVGEGTMKALDLDVFDIYYRHLFIWDRINNQLVGAYRIGHGDELFYGMGKKGFYLSQLFKIDNDFYPVMRSSLELGRSWVRETYQQKGLPLFLLWKGIALYLTKFPQYRYLIGPVSISSRFSKFSQSLLVAYITRHFYDVQMAKWVKPKKRFKPDFSNINSEALLENQASFRELENLIKDMESSDLRFPVLLRQYLELNAKIIAFNVDPKFSNSLDGLLVLDLQHVPENLKEKLMQ